MKGYIHLYFLFLALSFCTPLFSQEESQEPNRTTEFDLELAGEYRYFYDNALHTGQKDHFPSLAIKPEYSIEWEKQNQSLNFKGFFRLDVDDSRTHGDIRELYYQKVLGNWEVSLGLKKVYWGVAESNHIVDIINQTDAVESFDGEQKLGQPMAHFSTFTNYGTFDFFYLPYHRRRTFAGEYGRFRFGTVIDNDDLGYESGAEEFRQDFAFRWSHYIGIADIAVSHFHGSGREPLFVFLPNNDINAFYPVINQTGVELQLTHNAFLWKFEGIYRSSNNAAIQKAQDFIAIVGGLEYTFSNINGKGLDIGVLGEYLYDERDEFALTALQNDVFFGSRLAFNDPDDTSILFGGIADLDKETRIFSMEASRRIGKGLTAEIEGRFFSKVDNDELIFSQFRQDSFLRISISKYL